LWSSGAFGGTMRCLPLRLGSSAAVALIHPAFMTVR
jgi:hypothetical protein